ncbi:MAG TPA: AAA family ATPase [Marmoricola sp.]|nr:AAA family ATPase [Marmoricola sp.]
MRSAYDDVLDWAASRPWWQQQTLARIARGEALEEDDFVELARSLFEEPVAAPEGGWFGDLVPPTASNDEPVRILSVREVANVNQLAEGQELSFSPEGLTVVFGNNGSGKSGYARVLQSMVRTRYRASILPDVYAEAPGQQSGQVVFRVGESEHIASLGGPTHQALGRVSFFDEHCGDTYLDSEAEISYRPSAIQLLDDLTRVCNGVRAVIDGWKREKSQSGQLPEVDDLSPGGVFLRSLTAATSDEAIAAATACPPDASERLHRQVEEVARLRTANPIREKQRLSQTADALSLIAAHLSSLDQALGDSAEQRLAELRQRVDEAQQAADAASRTSFGDEPLDGIGSPVWQALWRAAEKYSETVYAEHEFPNTDEDAVCVLCQQPLSPEAGSRLNRFHQFVTDTTAREAEHAKGERRDYLQVLRNVSVAPRNVLSAIATVEQSDEGFPGAVQPVLDAFTARQSGLVADGTASPVEVAMEVDLFDKMASRRRQEAEGVDAEGFAEQLAQAESEERRLRDQLAMRDGRALIEQERERLRELETLNAKFTEANTRSITDKVGELTRAYVTEEARDRFTREADRLGLERVTFRATRARQGALLHKTDFLNARTGARLGDVLSEGEQTALGFAGFLTEAHFEASKSALIFDDPVSSLDHMKREAVAHRIVALAEERQVIVFTHDVAFTMALRKAAGEAGVDFTTRGVERRRKVGPGFTTMSHPWTAQDAAQRIDSLRQQVAALRKSEEGMSEADYMQATENIAGHMSQTWERIISQVLAEPLVDYKSLEVRVGKLRVVGRVSAEDVKTYDDSYSRISGWASRHDPHPELNYTPPTVQTLEDEIGVLDAWLKSVKRYQN